MKPLKKILLHALFICSPFLAQANTDIVIFSYNRPLQLYALLESMETYVTGLNEKKVIYRASEKEYEDAYQKVKQRFADVDFMAQGDNPQADFKPLTMEATFESSGEYVVFAVDDIIITDFVDMNECARLLEKTGAYGFYLRLGTNITQSYSMRGKCPVPPHVEVEKNVYAWRFNTGIHDWRYPHSVDFNVFKKTTIKRDFTALSFRNPNNLEAGWAGRGRFILDKTGLFFTYSKMINIPMNLVQTEYIRNNCMHDLSPKELLDVFNKGLKIDISKVFQMRNKAPHVEYNPVFIPRT